MNYQGSRKKRRNGTIHSNGISTLMSDSQLSTTSNTTRPSLCEKYYETTPSNLLDLFAEDTKMLGFRYLHSRYKLYFRVLWALLLFFFLGLTIYQVVERISYYLLRNPLVTKRYFDTPPSYQFPTVVICNKMQFKASSLAKHSPELLTVMSQMYQDDLNYNSTKIMKLIKKFEHTGMLDTFQKSYQSVDDFVISCQYGRKKQCMDSVKQFLTPNGICFSISPNSTVVRAGPESTLSILLNLETYDSIPGYVNDPGVILSIYDSNYTYPTRFYDDGVHLEPGKLVTIPINDIRSFERHHTECGVTSSGSFTPKQYSKLACEWVAKTEVIGKECKCSPLNSPDNRFIFGDDLGSGHFNKHFVFNVTSSSLPNCTLEQEYTCVKLILEQPLVKLQENYKNNNKCPEDCSDVRFTTIVFGNELDVNEVSSLLPINWEDEKEKKISDFYKAFALIPKNRISIIKSIQKLSIEAQEFIHSTKTLLHDFNNINKSVLFDVQNIKIHNCEAMFDSTILPKVFLELNTRERIWRNFAIYYDYVLTPNLVETPRLLKYNFNKFYGNENVNMFGRQNSTNDLNKENMDTLFDASMFELKLIQSSLENPLSVFGIKSMLEGERNTTINLMKNLVNATSQCLSKWKMTKNEESAAHRCGNVFNDNFIPLQAARFVAKILNGSDFLADFYQSLKNLTTIINNSAGKNGAKIFTYNNFEINLNEFQSFYKDDGNDLPLLFEIFRQRKLIQFEIPAKSSDISTTLFHFINSRSYFYSHKLDTAKSPFISLLNRTAYCFSNFSTTITTLKKQPFLRADWISRLNRDVIIAQSYSPGPQFDKVNLLHVKLYFSHIKRETIKNERSYNIFLLLAELGGTIGLYLGASIITASYSFMRKTILLVLLFVSPTLSSNNPSSTLKCLKKASYGSCKVFIRCCNFICQEQVSVAASNHTCVSLLGEIQESQSNCSCALTTSSASSTKVGSSFLSQPGLAFSRIHRTRQSSLSKLDWIAGVFLLFIIDMLFLSLSL